VGEGMIGVVQKRGEGASFDLGESPFVDGSLCWNFGNETCVCVVYIILIGQ